MNRARRIDANQPLLVDAFRLMGCTVRVTSHYGDGFPDLTVRKGKIVRFVEVKDGDNPPSARKLTDAEMEWQALLGDWYVVVEDLAQAHKLVADMMLKEVIG